MNELFAIFFGYSTRKLGHCEDLNDKFKKKKNLNCKNMCGRWKKSRGFRRIGPNGKKTNADRRKKAACMSHFMVVYPISF